MRWREDFPVRWDEDHYMTRRELAKFLTLGSGLLVSVNALIAYIGLTGNVPPAPERAIAKVGDIPSGGSLGFRYPTNEDPCILVRDRAGHVEAFSQVCTTSPARSCIARRNRCWRARAIKGRFRRLTAGRSQARRPVACLGS